MSLVASSRARPFDRAWRRSRDGTNSQENWGMTQQELDQLRQRLEELKATYLQTDAQHLNRVREGGSARPTSRRPSFQNGRHSIAGHRADRQPANSGRSSKGRIRAGTDQKRHLRVVPILRWRYSDRATPGDSLYAQVHRVRESRQLSPTDAKQSINRIDRSVAWSCRRTGRTTALPVR